MPDHAHGRGHVAHGREHLGTPAVPIQRQQALFFELGAHHLGRVPVDHHLDAHLEESHLGVVAVERQKALFARNARDFHDLLDQGVGGGEFELEGLDGDLEGPQKLLQAELGQHHKGAAADHDQHRSRLKKAARIAAQNDGGHNDGHRADESDEGSEIQSVNSSLWPLRGLQRPMLFQALHAAVQQLHRVY